MRILKEAPETWSELEKMNQWFFGLKKPKTKMVKKIIKKGEMRKFWVMDDPEYGQGFKLVTYKHKNYILWFHSHYWACDLRKI